MQALDSIGIALQATLRQLAQVGFPLQILQLIAAAALAVFVLVPALRQWREWPLRVLVGLLLVGEVVFAWFHLRLYDICAVIDPASGQVVGRVAVPLWIESEKLYVWAVLLGVLMLTIRRHREELIGPLSLILSALTAGALLVSQPYTQPLPDFLSQYTGYLGAMRSGVPQAMFGAFQGMQGSMTYFYNTWYMWVHPPMLFLSYGTFVISFVASMYMVANRSSAYETTAYRWARLGFLPLTAGMLLGFPWAILAWRGESWWWSGKVNMSIMMWLLYTAYLHGRLYLRRRGMWKVVAALAILSFAALVLTYLTTYIVPGSHSVAGG